MALSVALRHFTWSSADAVNTTYDVDFGFTPKFVILFNGGIQTDTTDTVVTTGRSRASIGFGTSSTDRRAMTYESLGGSAPLSRSLSASRKKKSCGQNGRRKRSLPTGNF